MTATWKVKVEGEKCSKSWEISVVREDNTHGQSSWGWFDSRKLLISHNGGPCSWPIIEFVWDRHVQTAQELCEKLNKGEIFVDDSDGRPLPEIWNNDGRAAKEVYKRIWGDRDE